MKKIDITKKITFDLRHIFWTKKGLHIHIWYHESAFKIHEVGILYFNGERRLEKGYTIKLSDDADAEGENVRFGSLAPEANDEMQKAMLGGLKLINEYFDSKQSMRKIMIPDIKVATTAVNTYAKLRQAESGYAMILLQLAKMSKEGKEALKYFVIDAMPRLVESEAKK